MNVSGRRGKLRLRFDRGEAEALTFLLDELTSELTEAAADDPVLARLFPAAYPDDAAAAAEFRELTESGLRAERLSRIETCAGELAVGEAIELADPDVARRWIQTLNDLRLAVGTRLGVTEDEPAPDPHGEISQPRAVYYWLTAVQDTVVSRLMH